MQTQQIELNSPIIAREGYLIPLSTPNQLTRPGGASYAIGDFFTVGRDLAAHLALNDPFASLRHARIEKRATGFVIRDLQSRNGTFVNGSRITEATLSANDRIRFGESVFVFSEAATNQVAMTSRNSEWNEQLKRLPAFAATDFPILVNGPSGAGKELIARALHDGSTRASGPFVSINCSALSENLIESELFGHVKGSFTGAVTDRRGAFETARGGTLFLDEIGDLPLSLQPKLLRAIENREIRPVGADRAIETDVRIVAATHKNMLTAIRLERFREDLYYRLNVCQIKVPSLKEHIEDFEDLLYKFAKQFRVRFSHSAIQALKDHPWPGNIRELKNLVARASAYYPGKNIQPEDLAAILEANGIGPEVHFVSEPSGSRNNSIIKEIEKEMILRRLVANRGNQRRTALELGIPKSTLHDLIKAYSIDVEQIARNEAATTASR